MSVVHFWKRCAVEFWTGSQDYQDLDLIPSILFILSTTANVVSENENPLLKVRQDIESAIAHLKSALTKLPNITS